MPSIDQCREIRQIIIEQGIYQFHIFMYKAARLYWMEMGQAKWEAQRALEGKYTIGLIWYNF